MKSRATYYILLAIITLAILTRFYLLGEAPAGLYLDEAAQGYNAYSILKTGKDEFGKSFPIVFRSFTDFKTPVYIYLLVPLIALFNLTKFTVRLPSAIFSILTFPFLFSLIKEIGPKKHSNLLALITSLLLAISPWHVLFGRTNFETNVALFFFIAGVYFFYKALKKPTWLLGSAVMFAIAIPAYHSQRIITPLMMLILFLRHKKTLLNKTHKKFLITGLIIGFLISLPTLSVATTRGFLMRAGLNIFSHHRQMPAGFVENCQAFFCPIINSSLFLSIKEFFALYVSYFSPRNMFGLGDSGPRSSFPAISTFFIWQFPFYLYGLWVLLKSSKGRSASGRSLKFFTLALLLIAPIPAALTRDPYSTIRSEPLVIPQLIIISLGIIKFYKLFQNKFAKRIALILFTLTVFYSIAKLHSSIIILNEHYRAKYWNYGWEEVTETIITLDPTLTIVVDNSRSEPYSQLLFFFKFSPTIYQKENFEVGLDEYYTNMNRNKTKKIGRTTTRQIDWKTDVYKKQFLIGDELTISEEQIKEHKLELVRDITYPDWSLAFRVVKTNPTEKCASDPMSPSEYCKK